MEFQIILIFYLLFLLVNGSSEILPAEVYWRSKFPTTPLPKVLKELLLLQPESNGNSSSFEEVELYAANMPGRRTTYGIGYWNAESKAFDRTKNVIPNNTTTYFLYNELFPNKKMKLIFTKSMNTSKFLPRKLAESIPFSTNKIQEILKYFSMNSTSQGAKIIKQTIKECEEPSVKGESKLCATSFESLVDFIFAKFGKNVQAFTNEAQVENKNQEYTILKGIKLIRDGQIVCHKQMYKYVVYYCHAIKATKDYMVPLVGANGYKAKAVVVCHFDTSAWNPQHMAFQVLNNVKPGGPAICHFLNSDTIVWVPN